MKRDWGEDRCNVLALSRALFSWKGTGRRTDAMSSALSPVHYFHTNFIDTASSGDYLCSFALMWHLYCEYCAIAKVHNKNSPIGCSKSCPLKFIYAIWKKYMTQKTNWRKVYLLNVNVYSPYIPVRSTDCTIKTPGFGTHCFTVSSPVGEN